MKRLDQVKRLMVAELKELKERRNALDQAIDEVEQQVIGLEAMAEYDARSRGTAKPSKRERRLSAQGRKNIVVAAKKRWIEWRKKNGKPPKK